MTPRPALRIRSSGAPRIQLPGLFISTMAQMRSPAPRKSVSTSAGLGTGLPSRAMTWNLWPPRAMRRFSMALALRKWNSTRWPCGDADGLARAQRLVVDGVGGGGDLQAVGRGVQDGGPLRLGRVGVVVGVHVDHLRGEEWLPVAQGEEQLLVVVAGVGCGLDVDEAELAGVRALVQVVHGHGVGVVPARAGRARA